MSNLKDNLIRLGNTNPELREHIRPVLDRLSRRETKKDLWPQWEEYKRLAGGEQALRSTLQQIGNEGARKAFRYIARMHDLQEIEITNRSQWGDLKDKFLRYFRSPEKLADEVANFMSGEQFRDMMEHVNQGW